MLIVLKGSVCATFHGVLKLWKKKKKCWMTKIMH